MIIDFFLLIKPFVVGIKISDHLYKYYYKHALIYVIFFLLIFYFI